MVDSVGLYSLYNVGDDYVNWEGVVLWMRWILLLFVVGGFIGLEDD